MAYSEYARAMAVEIVARNKGVLDAVALADIRATLKAPKLPGRTIRNWMEQGEVKNTSPVKKEIHSAEITVQEEVALRLDEKLERAAHIFVDHATQESTVLKMSGPAAMTSLGIAVEKMRLLRDLPTEIIGAANELTELAHFFRENNIEMSSAIREWRERLEARKAMTNIEQRSAIND